LVFLKKQTNKTKPKQKNTSEAAKKKICQDKMEILFVMLVQVT